MQISFIRVDGFQGTETLSLDAHLHGQSVLHAEHLVPVRCSEEQTLLEVTSQIEFVVF
jgi:hypothetical protein